MAYVVLYRLISLVRRSPLDSVEQELLKAANSGLSSFNVDYSKLLWALESHKDSIQVELLGIHQDLEPILWLIKTKIYVNPKELLNTAFLSLCLGFPLFFEQSRLLALMSFLIGLVVVILSLLYDGFGYDLSCSGIIDSILSHDDLVVTHLDLWHGSWLES